MGENTTLGTLERRIEDLEKQLQSLTVTVRELINRLQVEPELRINYGSLKP